MNVTNKHTYPLHLHISTFMLLLVIATGATITYLAYTRTAVMLESASHDLFVRIARETDNEFDQLFTPGEMATNLLALQRVARATDLQQRLDSLAFIKTALDSSPEVSSFQVGYGNGDGFLVWRIASPRDRKLMAAPEKASYKVQSIERSSAEPNGAVIYFDHELNMLKQDSVPEYAAGKYDARNADWYKKARIVDHLIRTAPYVSSEDGAISVAIARRAYVEGVVVAASIKLDSLAEVLRRVKASQNAQLALVGPDGKVLANEDMGRAVSIGSDGGFQRISLHDFGSAPLSALSKKIMPDGRIPNSKKGQLLEADLLVNGEKWLGSWVNLNISSDRPIYLAMAMPESDMLSEVRRVRRDNLISILLVFLLAMPFAVFLARSISRPLSRLEKEAEAVQRFDFSPPAPARSYITEVENLSIAVDGMRQTIRQFLHINQAVAAEDDFDVLMLKLLANTGSVIDATNGMLFLANAKGDRLKIAANLIDKTGHLFKTNDETPINGLPELLAKCIMEQTAQTDKLSATEFLALQQSAGISLAPSEQWAIALPLHSRKRQLVGALLFFTGGQANATTLSFLSALSASCAVSLETRELIRAQKELFESFIRMIAGAIDAKSPYTGGHCARVPELTKMLAQAACESRVGAYADFMLDKDDWEAVHIASWLHDCGKITSPEFIVDKATKLETIHDRIHEIRMRFELLKSSAETEFWKARVLGGDETALRKTLEAEWASLDDDFAFVAQCNLGSESLSAESQSRLHAIGERLWQRTLDDRMGISHEALNNFDNSPTTALPCQERLLADRPEHRIARPDSQYLDKDNPWEFRMQVPEWLYDRGELHNLCISRGTLTEEDRYKINEHIVQTIIMLSHLPFPKHLQGVPEIAGGHHEKMDGTGYPKQLTGEQMSPVARMMAIADIFEALTAVDRPYKKGKTLSEAIKIMRKMQREQHIDAELFELFLRSGVYLDYAKRYMPEQLIDHVDIEAMLAPET